MDEEIEKVGSLIVIGRNALQLLCSHSITYQVVRKVRATASKPHVYKIQIAASCSAHLFRMVVIEFDLIIRFCVCKIITVSSKFSVHFRREKSKNYWFFLEKILFSLEPLTGLKVSVKISQVLLYNFKFFSDSSENKIFSREKTIFFAFFLAENVLKICSKP